MRCYLVDRVDGGRVATGSGACLGGVVDRNLADLPPGDVLVRVRWSSLNYKDALAASGHAGVVKHLPHVPGIDGAGVVEESTDARFPPGCPVLVSSGPVGADRWGAWADYVRVPADLVIPVPPELSLRESMICGTAAFTAALCVEALQQHGIEPAAGEVVVTGATGGVGCFAVRLLSQLGYSAVAVTGKRAQHGRLLSWGARRVLAREEVDRDHGKPLLSARWAGAVDTVGGWMLASLVRETRVRGCVAACGVVAGADLPLTVYPFILRGVTLAGIDASTHPAPLRSAVWQKLAGPWRIRDLESLATTVRLQDLDAAVARILRGEIVGRVVVDLEGT
jgi:putative YhdH/YhfP family quinone oxidoreductase